MATREQTDWRELCVAVSNESDSRKLSSLVQQLIEALDNTQQTCSSRIDSFDENREAA